MSRLIDDSWKLDLLRSMVRPIVRIMLRSRITYGAFKDVAKEIYAEEALRRLNEQIQDRCPNLSELTVESGVPLPDLKPLLVDLERDKVARREIVLSAESAVLELWGESKRFQNESGEPATLPLTDDQGDPSFRELVRKATRSNVGYRDMLSRLISSGNVALSDDRQDASMLERHHISSRTSAESVKLRATAFSATAFLDTMDHNHKHTPESTGRLERKVYTRRATEQTREYLRSLLLEQSASLENQADEWESEGSSMTGTIVGAGYYIFEIPDQKTTAPFEDREIAHSQDASDS